MKLPAGKTIGIINFLNGIESSDRLASTTKLAIKELGWKAIQCDGKGTPTQFVACGNSLLDRGVNGIIEVAIEPGQIQSVLTKAKSQASRSSRSAAARCPPATLDGNYGPDEARSGKLLSDAMFQRTRARRTSGVAIQDFPAKWGIDAHGSVPHRRSRTRRVKITADYQTDAANLVPFTRKAVTDQLTKNPNLGPTGSRSTRPVRSAARSSRPSTRARVPGPAAGVHVPRGPRDAGPDASGRHRHDVRRQLRRGRLDGIDQIAEKLRSQHRALQGQPAETDLVSATCSATRSSTRTTCPRRASTWPRSGTSRRTSPPSGSRSSSVRRSS